MHTRPLVRRLAVAGGTAIAATTLSIPLATTAAEAAPVFLISEFESDTFAHDDGADCTPTETSSDDVTVPVEENGATVSYTGQGSATYQNDSVVGDTGSATVTGTVTSKITSAGGNLGSIDVTARGSGTLATALPSSDCVMHAGVGGITDFAFFVAQAGWLTVETTLSKGTYTSFQLGTMDAPYTEDASYDFKQSGTRKIFLPAGFYGGTTEIYVDLLGSAPKSATGSAELHASFAVAGSQVAAPRGKGATYVKLGARSCATDTVAAAVTGKPTRAGRVDRVTFRVNGKRVLTDRNPKRGEAYRVPVADDVHAEVLAVVRLRPRPGKPVKVLKVTSSHVACS